MACDALSGRLKTNTQKYVEHALTHHYIRPAHRSEEGFHIYGSCFWMDPRNHDIPWVIAELIGSISFEHTRRGLTRYYPATETQRADHPDTSHLP